MIQQLIEIRNNLLSALEQNDGMLAKMHVNKLDTLLHRIHTEEETLEETAERLAYDSTEENKGFPSMKKFIEGAKWQQERSYSEEEVLELLHKREDYMNSDDNIFEYKSINQWFKQFKKK